MNHRSRTKRATSFSFYSSPEVIRLVVIVFVGVPLPRQSVEGLLFRRRLRQAKGGFCFEQTFKPAHANGNNWAGSRRGTTGKPISASALALPKAVGPLSTHLRPLRAKRIG